METREKIIIAGIFTLIVGIGIGIWFFFNPKITITKNIEIVQQEKNISIDDTKIIEQSKEKFDYYSATIYPKEFQLECMGNTQACERILAQKDTLKTFSLAMVGKDIKVGEASNTNFDVDFSDTAKNLPILKEIVQNLYPKKLDNGKQKSPMLEMCESQIKQSIIPGTADEESIIEERIQKECIGMERVNELQTAFGGIESNTSQSSIILTLSLSKVNVEYTFLKEEGIFVKQTSEQKEIPLNAVLKGEIQLNSF